MSSTPWYFRVAWGLCGFILVASLFTTANLGFRSVRVVTKSIEKPVAPKTYEGFVSAYGAGKTLTAEELSSIGAPPGTTCAQWAIGDAGFAVMCKK